MLLILQLVLLTHGFELVNRGFELVTRGFELVTHRFELVTRGFELVTCISKLVTCVLLFQNFCGVLVGIYGYVNHSVKKKLSDSSGRILVCCRSWYRVSFDLPAQREYWTGRLKDFRQSIEGTKRLSGYKWKKYHFFRRL